LSTLTVSRKIFLRWRRKKLYVKTSVQQHLIQLNLRQKELNRWVSILYSIRYIIVTSSPCWRILCSYIVPYVCSVLLILPSSQIFPNYFRYQDNIPQPVDYSNNPIMCTNVCQQNIHWKKDLQNNKEITKGSVVVDICNI
jgi:hypothetical protein